MFAPAHCPFCPARVYGCGQIGDFYEAVGFDALVLMQWYVPYVRSCGVLYGVLLCRGGYTSSCLSFYSTRPCMHRFIR